MENKGLAGGGGSHRRTRLCLGIPCFAGKYREISAIDADIGSLTFTFASKSRASLASSL